MTRASEPTGLLILRVWREGTQRGEVRARITRMLDVCEPAHAIATARSVESIQAIVHDWLEDFLANTETDPPTE